MGSIDIPAEVRIAYGQLKSIVKKQFFTGLVSETAFILDLNSIIKYNGIKEALFAVLHVLFLSLESSQRHADKTNRAFSADQCSCWCTSWAEVNIRGASGVVSWMMRIENEASGYVFDIDPSLPDITQLLAPFRCKYVP